VVSTAIGIEGSGLIDGEHVLVADDAASFVEATLRLYRDAALWQRLSEAGQRFVRETVSPERGASFLAEAIESGWTKKLGLIDA
jgi:glycosyltransferase involved in cell wall biosynthesis